MGCAGSKQAEIVKDPNTVVLDKPTTTHSVPEPPKEEAKTIEVVHEKVPVSTHVPHHETNIEPHVESKPLELDHTAVHVPEPEPVHPHELAHHEPVHTEPVHAEHVHADPVHTEPIHAEHVPVEQTQPPAVVHEHIPSPSTAPILPKLKQGFISKEGQILKNWNNRYFVLDNGVLSYYEKPHNMSPYGINLKGQIPTLKGKKVIEEKDLLIRIAGGEARDILLKFDDEKSKSEWIAAIQEHINYANRQ